MSLDIDLIKNTEKFEVVLKILKEKKKKFYIFDGIIGAGKTTFINMLEKHLNLQENIKTKAILEPVELWKETNTLKYFYNDIPKNCYEFQTFTYITRVSTVIDEIYNNQTADIYLLERSIWTDRYIFMELLKPLVGELRMNMYNMWCDLWTYIMPLNADKWILLNTSLNESINRIKSRNRDGENKVDVEYQTNLYNKHIDFYNKLKNDGKTVIIVDSNLMDSNFITDNTIFNKIVDIII